MRQHNGRIQGFDLITLRGILRRRLHFQISEVKNLRHYPKKRGTKSYELVLAASGECLQWCFRFGFNFIFMNSLHANYLIKPLIQL